MFRDLVKRAGTNKAELSRTLGLNETTASSWRDNPPRYAVAYLELLIKYNRVRP